MPRPKTNQPSREAVTDARPEGSIAVPLLGLFAVAALVKLVILFQLADHPMLHPDSGLDTSAYADLARRVVAGDLWLGPGLYYLSPLYIYTLAAALAATDSFTGARIVQVLAGAAAVPAIWRMTAWWANPRAAWWAAGLAVLTGVVTFHEVLILQASLDTALTAAALLALAYALRSERPWTMTLAGAAFGLAALNRPNVLLVIVGLAAVMAMARRWRAALLLAAGAVLALAPVAVRNGVVAGEWLTVSSHGGLNLYIGNSPGATGFYQPVPGISPTIAGQAEDTRAVAGRALGRDVTDAEASDYFTGLALDWMRAHPVDAARLFAKKLAFTFHASHVPLPYSFVFYVHDTDSWLRWLPVGPWLLMPLGLVGIAVAFRRAAADPAFRVWVLFVPLYAAAVAVFFVADRYRLPLLVPMCVGAGIALDALASAVRERRWRVLVAPAAAWLVLMLLVNAPAGLNDGRWSEGLKLAQRLTIIGRDAEARTWTERLEATANPRGTAFHLVGRQYLAGNKPAQALPYLRDAVSAGLTTPAVIGDLAVAAGDSGARGEALAALGRLDAAAMADAELTLRLGRLAGRLQAPDEAVRFFARAVALDPSNADARLQFGVALVVQQKLEAARTELAAAVAANPRLADALAYLAYCEVALGNVETGRRHAEAALALEPAHPIAVSVLAAIK